MVSGKNFFIINYRLSLSCFLSPFYDRGTRIFSYYENNRDTGSSCESYDVTPSSPPLSNSLSPPLQRSCKHAALHMVSEAESDNISLYDNHVSSPPDNYVIRYYYHLRIRKMGAA